jgi:hypothetical protein
MKLLETWKPSRLRPDRRRTIRNSGGGVIVAALEHVERRADRFRQGAACSGWHIGGPQDFNGSRELVVFVGSLSRWIAARCLSLYESGLPTPPLHGPGRIWTLAALAGGGGAEAFFPRRPILL